MSDIKISVIVPCYNVEQFLERTVQQLDAQTYKNFDVILINDGSTDCTQTIAERLTSKRPNYRLFSFENAGLSEARNRGLKYAEGDYVYFLDADDRFVPTMFQRMVDLIVENDNPEIVKCGYCWCYENDKCGEQNSVCDTAKIKEKEELLSEVDDIIGFSESDIQKYYSTGKFEWKMNGRPVWNHFYSRKFLMGNNIRFVKGLEMVEDMVFNVTCLAYAKKLLSTPEILYHYVQHDNSLMKQITGNPEKLYKNKFDAMLQRDNLRKLFLERYNIDIVKYYRGSNVIASLQMAVILSGLSYHEGVKMYNEFVLHPLMCESFNGFPIKTAPIKIKLPLLMLQHGFSNLLFLSVKILNCFGFNFNSLV